MPIRTTALSSAMPTLTARCCRGFKRLVPLRCLVSVLRPVQCRCAVHRTVVPSPFSEVISTVAADLLGPLPQPP